jgi:hypothetical protein
MQSHDTIELAFIVIAALALLTQAVVMLAIYLGISKIAGNLKDELAAMRASVMPTIHNTRDMVERATPKIEQAIEDVSRVTAVLKVKAVELDGVTSEIMDRVRKETGRVDTMFSGALDAVDKASVFVTHTVAKPVRQLSGILASIKAIVESLSTPHQAYHERSAYQEPRTPADEDLFV